MRGRDPYRTDRALILVSALALVALSFLLAGTVLDDAFIFSRYAKHVIAQHDVVWICENFVVDRPLAAMATLDDAALLHLGAWKLGQRALLRHPALARSYEPALDAPATCLRRMDLR